jgi:hypothetical protein
LSRGLSSRGLLGRGLLAGGSGPASICNHPLKTKQTENWTKYFWYCMLLQNWTKYICTGSILQAKFRHVSKADDAHFRAFAPCGGCFSAARVSGRSNHPSLSLRRLHFHLFASWPPVGRAVRRTTQSRCARSTAAAASHGRLGTASPPCPEPRAVPSPLLSEPHATCDATNRHCPAD